ncbi:MAG: sulfite exporter TauE/SafE family protein [Clostridia bacterium]|nr:sulfite exporter TauE/SafE family protein [Clostridia bacterium]
MWKKRWKEIVIGLSVGILNGLFGAGGGSLLVPLAERFLGMEGKVAHATTIPIILVMSAISSFFYIRQGFFDFDIWLFVSIGGLLGGFVGAKLLNKIPKRWLKAGFGVIICFTAVKMIFKI